MKNKKEFQASSETLFELPDVLVPKSHKMSFVSFRAHGGLVPFFSKYLKTRKERDEFINSAVNSYIISSGCVLNSDGTVSNLRQSEIPIDLP